MGVPLFAKTITRKYPDIVGATVPKCSRLFLDLNCAIHNCTNNLVQRNQVVAHDVLEAEIVSHTLDYIKTTVEYVRPTDLLMIAIDGIPPRAKILQQRKRRFVGSWRQGIIDRKRKEMDSVYTEWDRNAITPGTPFMNYLSRKLHEHFDAGSFPYKVILSDSNEVGEGEAKILDHIKETDVPTHSDIIYGLDADLIMLGLLSSRNNIYLLREPVHYDMKVPKPFLLFDITLLRRCIAIECDSKPGGERERSAVHDANTVWDYVALCFLQGNDFMPSLSYLKIRHNGIEMCVQIYKTIKKDLEQNLVVRDSSGTFELNYLFLLQLLEKLRAPEDACFCEAEEKYYANRAMPFVGKRSPLERLAFEIDNYPTLNKFPRIIKPEKPGWRLRYYHALFNETTEIQEINEICENYLEAIQWTMDYYFNRKVEQHWYYKYNYSPTILDLCNFLLINFKDTKSYIYSSIAKNYPVVEYDTDLQLLMCLPPSSSQLLKPQLRRIMFDVPLGCLHMYPEVFGITGYLKNYLWEAYPVLPPVDMEKLNARKNELLL
jgi:5'-3' exoribonuclease 1